MLKMGGNCSCMVPDNPKLLEKYKNNFPENLKETIVLKHKSNDENYKEDAETLYNEFITEEFRTSNGWMDRSIKEWNEDILYGSDYIVIEMK